MFYESFFYKIALKTVCYGVCYDQGKTERNALILMIIRIILVSVMAYFCVPWLISQLNPNKQQKKRFEEIGRQKLKSLGAKNVKNLTDHELMIASHLVIPSDITVSWNNIAGLSTVIDGIKQTVIFPVQRKELLRNSTLTKPPRGVLLYGPPGCGKTMIAKATAREAGMNFLYLDVSLLTDKLYGESAKLAGAVFSLAQKLQPIIIFIDEIDCFLRSRNKNDNEASAMMKAQFMMLWDGLTTDPENTVIIMGATNRPSDLDPAILRRMPATFKISLPEQQQREEILTLILTTEKFDRDVDFKKLAEETNDFSGSDLKELCRDASLSRIKDLIKKEEHQKKSTKSHLSDSVNLNRLRPINMNDLIASVMKTKLSKVFTDTHIRLGTCASSGPNFQDSGSGDVSLSRIKDLIKEELQKKFSKSHLSDPVNLNRLRPINMNDLNASFTKTKTSKVFTDTHTRLGTRASSGPQDFGSGDVSLSPINGEKLQKK